jgi:hypothetical protein
MPTEFDAGSQFMNMRLVWTVEAGGSASMEIALREEDMGTIWTPPHRILINGPKHWGGEITNIKRSGPPGDIQYTASGLGHAHRLDQRIVRHDFVVNDHGDVHVEALLSEAQDNQINGDMGFTMGSVVGTCAVQYRAYCYGVSIGDAIRELAVAGRGFDWEINPQGYLNIWAPGRGDATALTLADTDTHYWEAELDTSELLTTVSMLASNSDPYGPKHRMVRTARADDLGRREEAIDTSVIADDETNPNWEDELYDAGHALLKERGGGLLNLKTTWLSDNAPWELGDVWLQDSVMADLPDFFGGPTRVRCTDVTVTIDAMPPRGTEAPIYWVDMSWDALIADLDLEDGDPDVVI